MSKPLLAAFIVPVVAMFGLVVAHGEMAPPATAASSFPPCHVTLSTDSAETQATATIVSGCVGPGFAFRSFVGIRTDDLFDSVTAPPWVVKLPQCPWQIDFSFTSSDPVHHIYAFLTGGSGSCTPPTTTTTTTAVPPTTTTTASTSTTSTTTSTLPPVTTTTTLPQITSEKKAVELAPGVTAGRG